MRLVHHFEHSSETWRWPENYADLTELIEDGDETVLYVDYADKHFRRPMEPLSPDDLRREYSGKREVQG